MQLHAGRHNTAQPGPSFIVLRACRFFLEQDDREATRGDTTISDEDNLKFVHTLNGRRLTLRDVVGAHMAALRVRQRFALVNLGNVVALQREDAVSLGDVARGSAILVARYGEPLRRVLETRQWLLPSRIDRVYDVSQAVRVLHWTPVDTPAELCRQLLAGEPIVW